MSGPVYILRLLPNLIRRINGVDFLPHPLGSVSSPMSPEAASAFLALPNFRIATEAEALGLPSSAAPLGALSSAQLYEISGPLGVAGGDVIVVPPPPLSAPERIGEVTSVLPVATGAIPAESLADTAPAIEGLISGYFQQGSYWVQTAKAKFERLTAKGEDPAARAKLAELRAEAATRFARDDETIQSALAAANTTPPESLAAAAQLDAAWRDLNSILTQPPSPAAAKGQEDLADAAPVGGGVGGSGGAGNAADDGAAGVLGAPAAPLETEAAPPRRGRPKKTEAGNE